MLDTTKLIVFICLLVLILILSLVFIYIDFFKSAFISIFKKTRVSAKLKKFAVDHDFPLLSDVVIQIREKLFIKIDHIMIGNKYIYVIASKCWYGYLNAKAIDDKWLLYRADKLLHVDNPLKNNAKRIKLLASFLDSSENDFVNIIYLAKPVVSDKITCPNPYEFVVLEDDFEKFIEVYEKESKLNEFSIKSIEEAAKKIFDYHKKSLIQFKEINKKKERKDDGKN